MIEIILAFLICYSITPLGTVVLFLGILAMVLAIDAVGNKLGWI